MGPGEDALALLGGGAGDDGVFCTCSANMANCAPIELIHFSCLSVSPCISRVKAAM